MGPRNPANEEPASNRLHSRNPARFRHPRSAKQRNPLFPEFLLLGSRNRRASKATRRRDLRSSFSLLFFLPASFCRRRALRRGGILRRPPRPARPAASLALPPHHASLQFPAFRRYSPRLPPHRRLVPRRRAPPVRPAALRARGAVSGAHPIRNRGIIRGYRGRRSRAKTAQTAASHADDGPTCAPTYTHEQSARMGGEPRGEEPRGGRKFVGCVVCGFPRGICRRNGDIRGRNA